MGRVFIPKKIKRAENWAALKATRYFSLLLVHAPRRKSISELYYGELLRRRSVVIEFAFYEFEGTRFSNRDGIPKCFF